MNKKKVLAILNSSKTKRADLIKIIYVSKIPIKNTRKYTNIQIIKMIMKKFKIDENDLKSFMSVSKLKQYLKENKLPARYFKKGMKKEEYFNLYNQLRKNLITKDFETHGHLEKGKRAYMEDNVYFSANNNYQFSSVFDGHGGKQCSLYLKRELFPIFLRHLKKKQIKQAIVGAYLQVNKNFLNKNTESGSTCNTLIINKKTNKFFVANVGDSRAILCQKNGIAKAITKDHKPSDPKEKRRIIKSGGFVEDDRVDGILAMSRAMGDKKLVPHVGSTPDIFEGSLRNVKYIVQASDGLYDVMSNQEICNYINQMIKNKVPRKQIPYILVNYAINTKKTTDNTSAIITFIS